LAPAGVTDVNAPPAEKRPVMTTMESAVESLVTNTPSSLVAQAVSSTDWVSYDIQRALRCLPEIPGAPQDESDGFARLVPHRKMAAVVEPVQLRIGEQFLGTSGLTGQRDPVLTSPADGHPTRSRARRCSLLQRPINECVQYLAQ